LTDLFEPEIACVAVPAFPLQVVLRAHPEWRDDALVIVEDDRPLARILWANRSARRHRIVPGQKFSEARSLVARLRAVAAPAVDSPAVTSEIFARLLSFSPRVEPAEDPSGVFWMDPRGLGRLYDSHASWASRVERAVAEQKLVASVVVGWSRANVLAVSLAVRGVRVFRDPAEETQEADRVDLPAIELPPELRRSLHRLGLTTLGELRRLPASGLAARFGGEAAALQDFLCGRTWTPLRPAFPERSFRMDVPVDPPDDDRNRLLFAVKGALHELTQALRAESKGVVAVELSLALDHAGEHHERIETAAPTLDVVRLVDLVRLRLAGIELPAPVEQVSVEVRTREVSPGQLALLETPPPRDRARAAEALSRVRAAFGGTSVVRARLVDAYLPESRVRWETLTEVPEPDPPAPPGLLPLMRALFPVPRALPDLPRHERESWLGHHGAVETLRGPDRVSGGWWNLSHDRDYFFAETRTGEILWLFFERAERSWYLHGFVD
jgi:protein ImuB